MKKIFCFALGLLTLAGCHLTKNNSVKSYEQSQAYYSDWDRAIRIDTDMQNMYLNTPRQIEKPIDMYMVMALALKYNYTRRMVSYEENLLKAGNASYSQLQEILNKAGYVNNTNSSQMSPDLKVAWNILDMSTVYSRSADTGIKTDIAMEQSRKVIHNITQEARSLYWKTLTAQRLLPVIDDMTEFLTLEVDEMNAVSKELASENKAVSRDDLIKKRNYMEAIKNLSALKHDLETAQSRLAGLMGLHPSSSFKLVGTQYGNFELPEIRSNIAQLEWLALSNRPELRVHDLIFNPDDQNMIIQKFNNENASKYKTGSKDYKEWSKQGCDTAMNFLEAAQKAGPTNIDTLRRQRMTSLILNQVYVAWAQYMAAAEDYQINMEIADTSENIAEDFAFADGTKNEKSQLEAARAIEDEVRAFLSYVDVQEALGNLYATIGLDSLPYYMLEQKPSEIALYLRGNLDRWTEGNFIPDNRPYLMDIPSKRPPVQLTTNKLPDVTVETGQNFSIIISPEIFEKLHWKGTISIRVGLIDDKPLPSFMTYVPEENALKGRATTNDGGVYRIKVYGMDENGNLAFATFKLIIREVYYPSLKLRGVTEGREALVLKRCISKDCADDLTAPVLGQKVQTKPLY